MCADKSPKDAAFKICYTGNNLISYLSINPVLNAQGAPMSLPASCSQSPTHGKQQKWDSRGSRTGLFIPMLLPSLPSQTCLVSPASECLERATTFPQTPPTEVPCEISFFPHGTAIRTLLRSLLRLPEPPVTKMDGGARMYLFLQRGCKPLENQ